MESSSNQVKFLNTELGKALQNHQKVTSMMANCSDPAKKNALSLELKVWSAKIISVNGELSAIRKQTNQDQNDQVTAHEQTKTSQATNGKKNQENKQVSHMSLRSESNNYTGPTPPKRSADDKSSQGKSPARKKVLFNSLKTTKISSPLPTQPTAVASDGMYEDLNDADDSVLEPVVVTDEMRKENFLSGLGLVTKAAHKELQNRKSVRKRRTTANPQFSNAAIEAKKANQMVIAANKLKNKELMKTRYSLKVDAGQRRQQRIKEEEEEEEQHKRKTSSKDKKNSPPKQEKGHHHKTSKALSSSNTVNSAQSKLPSSSEVQKECCFCSEDCDAENDAIMFCTVCRVLFHVTCASTIEEITASGVVPCPQCGRKKQIQDQVTDLSSILSPEVERPVTPIVEVIVPKKRGRKPKQPKVEEVKTSPQMVTLNRENGTSEKVAIRSHYEEKRSEIFALLEKKTLLESQWRTTKATYESHRTNFLSLRENHDSLILAEKDLTKKIEKVVGFIKSAKIWNDIIDTDDHQHSQGIGRPIKKAKQVLSTIHVEPRVQPPSVTYSQPKKVVGGQTLLKVPTIFRSHDAIQDPNNDRKIGVIFVPTAGTFNSSQVRTTAVSTTSFNTNFVPLNSNGSTPKFINIAPKPVMTTNASVSLLKPPVTAVTPAVTQTVPSPGPADTNQTVVVTKEGVVLPCEDSLTLSEDNSNEDHTMSNELIMDDQELVLT